MPRIVPNDPDEDQLIAAAVAVQYFWSSGRKFIWLPGLRERIGQYFSSGHRWVTPRFARLTHPTWSANNLAPAHCWAK